MSKKKKRFGIKIPRESRLLRVISVIVCEGINKTIKLSPVRITFPQVLFCGFLSISLSPFFSLSFPPRSVSLRPMKVPSRSLYLWGFRKIEKRACAPNSHVASTLLRTWISHGVSRNPRIQFFNFSRSMLILMRLNKTVFDSHIKTPRYCVKIIFRVSQIFQTSQMSVYVSSHSLYTNTPFSRMVRTCKYMHTQRLPTVPTPILP